MSQNKWLGAGQKLAVVEAFTILNVCEMLTQLSGDITAN